MLWVVFSHLAELLNWKGEGEETTLLVKNLNNQKNPKVLEALLPVVLGGVYLPQLLDANPVNVHVKAITQYLLYRTIDKTPLIQTISLWDECILITERQCTT